MDQMNKKRPMFNTANIPKVFDKSYDEDKKNLYDIVENRPPDVNFDAKDFKADDDSDASLKAQDLIASSISGLQKEEEVLTAN